MSNVRQKVDLRIKVTQVSSDQCLFIVNERHSGESDVRDYKSLRNFGINWKVPQGMTFSQGCQMVFDRNLFSHRVSIRRD